MADTLYIMDKFFDSNFALCLHCAGISDFLFRVLLCSAFRTASFSAGHTLDQLPLHPQNSASLSISHCSFGAFPLFFVSQMAFLIITF